MNKQLLLKCFWFGMIRLNSLKVRLLWHDTPVWQQVDIFREVSDQIQTYK